MSNQKQIDEIIKILSSGNIIIYPTETLYGMGADAHNEQAVEKLFKLKKRDLSKPVPVLIPHRKAIEKYAKNVSPVAQALMHAFWPGALTVILESNAFPKGVASAGKVGFRLSAHPLTATLLYKFDRCITATSANIANKPTPEDPREFFKIFPPSSFVLVEEQNPAKPSEPSTVIDCTVSPYKIVREGVISSEEIEEVLKEAGLS